MTEDTTEGPAVRSGAQHRMNISVTDNFTA